MINLSLIETGIVEVDYESILKLPRAINSF